MPPVNLHERIRDVLASVRPLPPEANSPIAHFRRTSSDLRNTLDYLESKVEESIHKQAVANRHLNQLHQMALVSLVENLERFFKELAGLCIDVLAPVTADDRFDTFRVGGSSIAGHFGSGSLGRALCEAGTWLDCKTINDRFRDILRDTTQPAPLQPFQLLPLQPIDEKARYDTLQLIWQLRHTVVHNVGMITHSDAVRLRVLSKRTVTPLQTIQPSADDIDHIAKFLSETADRCNRHVADRLAEVLTRIRADSPALVDPSERAAYLAEHFGRAVTVAGVRAMPPL
jgi:hypothetical protein